MSLASPPYRHWRNNRLAKCNRPLSQKSLARISQRRSRRCHCDPGWCQSPSWSEPTFQRQCAGISKRTVVASRPLFYLNGPSGITTLARPLPSRPAVSSRSGKSTKLCIIRAFQTSQRCRSSLHSAAYDFATSSFRRFATLDFCRFNFIGSRGNATRSLADQRHVAGSVARQYDSATFFVANLDSFSERPAAYRRAFQKSESSLDRAGGNGWPRLGYSD